MPEDIVDFTVSVNNVVIYQYFRGEFIMPILGTTANLDAEQTVTPYVQAPQGPRRPSQGCLTSNGPKAQAQQGPLDFSGLAKIPVKFAGAEVLMTVEQFAETLESMMATAFGHGIRFKESSCIKDMKYIVSERALVVTFPGSGTYRYENVTPADIVFLSDGESESVGRRFNEWRNRVNPATTKLS
jgi:hypothetical protein